MSNLSINKAILAGNVGAEPDVRYMPNGKCVTTVRLATSKRYKEKDEWKELTEWHTLKFFDKIGETASNRIQKGTAIYTEGEIHTRKWQDKDGQDRFSTEIHVDVLKVVARGKPSEQQQSNPQGNNQGASGGESSGGDDESWKFGNDIPY